MYGGAQPGGKLVCTLFSPWHTYVRRAAEPGLVLHVSDNGVGMRLNGVETGLGLQLIRAFAAQLHGTLAFAESLDGTGTAVTLPLPRGAKPRYELELQS
jgi:two-component sensor histidine kinase